MVLGKEVQSREQRKKAGVQSIWKETFADNLKKNTDSKNAQKKKQPTKNVFKEKREAQVRSFFGRHFKKQVYVDKKEEIIQAVLRSKTKQQVNNNLMKHFTSKEVKIICQRLEPLIRNLPGK